ncbi:MAG: carbohydrate binding family 9 domain-containing protein [Myxococcota bacterium]
MWTFAIAALAGPPPTVVPTRAAAPVVVDGVLDEAVWQGEPITGFTQWEPAPGAPGQGAPGQGTRAWIAYDDRNLYVAFDARVDPGRAQSNALSPRDRNRGEDTVGVLLDTYRDGQRAFLFMVNGHGVQGDAIFVDGESELSFQADMSWDGVWDCAATTADGVYRVELAIPFRTLRFPRTELQTWGLVLVQNVPVPSAVETWPTLDADVAGILTQSATLGPFPLAGRPSRLELMPTLTSVFDVQPPIAHTGPLGWKVDPGIGARIGLTSSSTAELTVNPDFSQIESDAAQVSANVKFPLFYPERRPFFLENADLYATPVTLAHTRSIVDPLLGYKVSGRAGPVAVAWLGAYDETPAPSTISVDYATGAPLPTWGPVVTGRSDAIDDLIRVRGDVGGGSSLGVLVSDKELRVGGFDAERTIANRVAAIDGQWVTGRYALTGQLLGSSTEFPDGTAATAPGWAAAVHRQGAGWVFDLGHSFLSPGFRAENGFLTEVGRVGFSGDSALLFRPGPAARLVAPGLEAAISLTPDAEVADASAGPTLELQLGDRWTIEATGGYRRERFASTDFDLWYEEANVNLRAAPAWFVGVAIESGSLPHYAARTEAELYQGFHWFVGPQTNADLFGRMNVDLGVAIDQFSEAPGAPAVYSTVIGRSAIQLTVTPEVYLRWIEQYDSTFEVLESSFLAGYVVNYGTTAYLGYTETVPYADGEPERTAFAKVSYLARF